MNDTPESLFADHIIFAYSRREALEDGVLVDVTERAWEAGFRLPVALTAALWSDIGDIPENYRWQDVAGRLWDVLWRGVQAARSSRKDSDTLFYSLHLPVGATTAYRVKLVCGPGDTGEPVITLMLPDED